MENAKKMNSSKSGTCLASNKGGIIKIAEGQKIILYAIFICILSALVKYFIYDFNMIIISLALQALFVWGLVKISQGIGYALHTMILLIVLLFIPIINLILLLYLVSKATTELKKAGYKVGLLGAKM